MIANVIFLETGEILTFEVEGDITPESLANAWNETLATEETSSGLVEIEFQDDAHFTVRNTGDGLVFSCVLM